MALGYLDVPQKGMGASGGSVNWAKGAIPVIGGPMVIADLVSSLEGGSSSKSRMSSFQASLQAAKGNASQAIKTIVPRAQRVMSAFASAAQQVNDITASAQNLTDPNVADVLSQLGSDFQTADALITNPIGGLIQAIQDAADTFKAGESFIDAWNVNSPAQLALDDIVHKYTPALTKAVSAANGPLRQLQQDIASAKPLIDRIVAAQKAADAKAMADALAQARQVILDTVASADQAAQGGDPDSAAAILSDSSIQNLAATAGMSAPVNGRIAGYQVASARKKEQADQQAQMDQMRQMIQMWQSYRSGQSAPTVSAPFLPSPLPSYQYPGTPGGYSIPAPSPYSTGYGLPTVLPTASDYNDGSVVRLADGSTWRNGASSTWSQVSPPTNPAPAASTTTTSSTQTAGLSSYFDPPSGLGDPIPASSNLFALATAAVAGAWILTRKKKGRR